MLRLHDFLELEHGGWNGARLVLSVIFILHMHLMYRVTFDIASSVHPQA